MSEAYLFAAGEAPDPTAALGEALGRAGARPAWLGELHWLGAPTPALLADRPCFTWPEAPLLALFCLQSVLRGLESGATDLALVGQAAPGASLALLLGGPHAVGRWNLPPLARLHPLAPAGGAPVAFLQALAGQAAAALPEESRLAGLSLAGLDASGLPAELAGLPRLADAPELARPARLLDLLHSPGEAALLAAHAGQAGLGLLVERL